MGSFVNASDTSRHGYSLRQHLWQFLFIRQNCSIHWSGLSDIVKLKDNFCHGVGWFCHKNVISRLRTSFSRLRSSFWGKSRKKGFLMKPTLFNFSHCDQFNCKFWAEKEDFQRFTYTLVATVSYSDNLVSVDCCKKQEWTN